MERAVRRRVLPSRHPAVDFALLDRKDSLLGNPYHYRDARTTGIPEHVSNLVPPDELYERTGIQTMQINTLYQLYITSSS
jgi:rhamnulokinase